MTQTCAVRAYAPGDLDAADRLLTQAFGNPSSPALETRLALPGTRAFVAVDATNAVAGFVSLSLYGRVAYVGSMAVDAAARRTGVGKLLMEQLITYCREHDVPAIALDATADGEPLYARFGFAVTDRTIVMERVAPFQHTIARPSDANALAFAIAVDRELLECDRSELLTMLATQDDSYVAADEDGYAMCWGKTAGPVVANSPYGARAVLSSALRESTNITRMLIPESTPDALEIASAHGFKIVRAVSHMARGHSPLTREEIYARASHSYG